MSAGHSLSGTVYALADQSAVGKVNYYYNSTGPTLDGAVNINLANRRTTPHYDFMRGDNITNLKPFQSINYVCSTVDFYTRAIKLNGTVGTNPIPAAAHCIYATSCGYSSVCVCVCDGDMMLGWSEVRPLIGAYQGQSSMFAVRAVRSRDASLAVPKAMVFCTVFAPIQP